MRSKVVVRTALFLLALSVLPTGLAAQKGKRPVKLNKLTVIGSADVSGDAQRRMNAFEMAWATLEQNYFDKTFGGLNWAGIHKEFRPRVKAAKTDVQFHQILEEMLKRLGRSHLSIVTPEYFERLETAKQHARDREKLLAEQRRAGGGEDGEEAADEDTFAGDPASLRYGIGVELRMLGDQMVITRVDPDSGAAAAGLRAGFVIDKINGVSLKEVIDLATLEGTSEQDIRYLLPLQIVESFLNGEPETSVVLTCLDDTNKAVEFTVPRHLLAGEAVSIGSNFPEQFLKYEARALSEDVGYIKFNAFAVPVIGKFCDSLTEFGAKKAIIVDLRGNLGGIVGSMVGLSGMLTDKPITLGNFVSRAGSEPFTVLSKARNFKGRIVVLVDGQSMSAAEMFAAGLQGNRRAVVVGGRTGGKSLPAVWITLPTGAVMMYPVADFITPGGASLEGTGLAPDHEAALDRGSLLRGVDIQLEKAMALAADAAAFARTIAPKTVGQGSGTDRGRPALPPPPIARPQATPSPTPAVSDQRSLKIIADYTAAMGGADAIERLATYEAKGNVSLGQGQQSGGRIYAARQFPDKFLVVITSPALGEVREIYNGKNSYLQADYGIDRSLYQNVDTTRLHLFAPVFDALDLKYLNGLKYEGPYEVEGRMRHVLSATSPTGLPVGLSFDQATKMLVTFSLPGVLYTFSEYRSINGVQIPFQIDLDRIMNVRLDTVIVNPKLDPASFEKVEKCFDKALGP